jgi:hypothetical protein
MVLLSLNHGQVHFQIFRVLRGNEWYYFLFVEQVIACHTREADKDMLCSNQALGFGRTLPDSKFFNIYQIQFFSQLLLKLI